MNFPYIISDVCASILLYSPQAGALGGLEKNCLPYYVKSSYCLVKKVFTMACKILLTMNSKKCLPGHVKNCLPWSEKTPYRVVANLPYHAHWYAPLSTIWPHIRFLLVGSWLCYALPSPHRLRFRLAFNYMNGRLPMTGLSPARIVPCPAHIKAQAVALTTTWALMSIPNYHLSKIWYPQDYFIMILFLKSPHHSYFI